MSKKQKIRSGLIFVSLFIVFLAGSILTANPHKAHGDIQEVMRDAVLHETGQIRIFGDFTVNPGLVSAFVVTGILFVFALCVRLFLIPRFTMVPGRFQMLLEQLVELLDDLTKGNSPHRNKFLGGYVFTVAVYIFVSTIFELFGFQVLTVNGTSISLPAPLSDINGAICLGCLSYLVIMSGGIVGNGIKGIGKTLKEFSLPISMSFRLFGALLSGALVTELVYYYSALSYGLPILVGVMFTLLHAVIQAYVLAMLTSMYYGEVTESEHHS